VRGNRRIPGYLVKPIDDHEFWESTFDDIHVDVAETTGDPRKLAGETTSGMYSRGRSRY
jgi:hypothetical protein